MRIRKEVKLPVEELKSLRSLLRQLAQEKLDAKSRHLVTRITIILCERPSAQPYE